MKIVHLNWAFPIGGLESILVDTINEQVKTESVFLVIINSVVNSLVLDRVSKSVKVIILQRKPGSRNILPIVRLNWLLCRIAPDIVVCHNSSLIRVLKLRRYKTALHFHHIMTDHYEDHSRDIGKYNTVFSISNAVSDSLMRKAHIDKPVLVYNGLPLSEIKEKQTYDYRRFRIVQIGRLNHKIKGQDILLKACGIIIGKYRLRNIEVSFVGEGSSRGYLEGLVRKLDIEHYCSFLGEQARSWVFKHLCKYNLLVQPSRVEGFGNTVIEAMAARIPVLVHNMYGPMEIIQNGKYGYCFGIGDANDCAAKILQIIADYGGEDTRTKLDLAYDYVRKNFDITQTAKSFLDEYRKVLGSNNEM